jgi:hypothetical protein
MNSIFKTVASLVSVFATTFAFAQEVPANDPAICCEKFKIDWTVSASIYDLDAGNIFVLDNRFTTDITDKFTVGVSVPVINNSNEATNGGVSWQLNNGGPEFNGTGFSDIDLFVVYDLWDGKCSYLAANAQVDLIGGVKAPIDGNFSSSDPVLYIGGVAELSKDAWKLTQGIKWEIVDDYTFNPVFGGFIDGDVLALDTKFMYTLNNGMNLGAKVNQQYTDGSGVFLLGPAFDCKVGNGLLNVDLGFAVAEDIPYDEIGAVVSVGFNYAF